MRRITILREQTSILRSLANSFDVLSIRNQLLDLAARCDEMAKSMEENPQVLSSTRLTCSLICTEQGADLKSPSASP